MNSIQHQRPATVATRAARPSLSRASSLLTTATPGVPQQSSETLRYVANAGWLSDLKAIETSTPARDWKFHRFCLNPMFIAFASLIRYKSFLGSFNKYYKVESQPIRDSSTKTIKFAATRLSTGQAVVVELLKKSVLLSEFRNADGSLDVGSLLLAHEARFIECFIAKRTIALVLAADLPMLQMSDRNSSADKAAEIESSAAKASLTSGNFVKAVYEVEKCFQGQDQFEEKAPSVLSQAACTEQSSAIENKDMSVVKWLPLGACIVMSLRNLNNLQFDSLSVANFVPLQCQGKVENHSISVPIVKISPNLLYKQPEQQSQPLV